MTINETNNRLSALPAQAIEQITRMINDGYGARGIALDTTYSVKQINAVFALVHPAR